MSEISESIGTVGHFTIHEVTEPDGNGKTKVIGYLIIGPTGVKSGVMGTKEEAIERAKKYMRRYRNRPKPSPPTPQP